MSTAERLSYYRYQAERAKPGGWTEAFWRAEAAALAHGVNPSAGGTNTVTRRR